MRRLVVTTPIKCAAVNYNGTIYTGRSHGTIIMNIVDRGELLIGRVTQDLQGFVDEYGNFLDRTEAYWRAVEHGQIKDDGKTPVLFSEML
jgi:hypothetical protein